MDKILFDRPRKIGLIAGEGEYPLLLSQVAISHGTEIIGIGFEGMTWPEIGDVIPNFIWVKFGQIEPIIQGFVEHNVTQAMFAGRIKQSVIFESKDFDPIVKNTLAKLPNQQADSLIGAAANAFGMFGVNFLDGRTFMEAHIAMEGLMTHKGLTDDQLRDIEYGYRIAKHIAEEDIGQTVVVKNRAVLAVEAIEGTDNTIKRAIQLGKDNFTIVKVSKPQQDFRYDIPVIGPGTVNLCSKAENIIIAVESEKTLMLNRDTIIAEADDKGVSIFGVKTN